MEEEVEVKPKKRTARKKKVEVKSEDGLNKDGFKAGEHIRAKFSQTRRKDRKKKNIESGLLPNERP